MQWNKTEIKQLLMQITEEEQLITALIDKQVRMYCRDLDNCVTDISQTLNDPNAEITDRFLETVILQLPKVMYWASEGQEILNTKADLAKNHKNEQLLKYLQESTGTVAQRNMTAELESLEEHLVYQIYSHASIKIGLRLKYATELLQSAKKLFSKRINEISWDSGQNISEIRYNKDRNKKF